MSEAAERLLEPRPRDIIVLGLMGAGYEEDPAEMLVESALAAERKATVERIAIDVAVGSDGGTIYITRNRLNAILDAEAAR